jgi:two-component system, chemotaxis family, sensor kinase CheA
MNTKNDEFRNKLLATFKVEAEEHVTAMASALVELEKAADPEKHPPIIESAFREAHSLKGAARAVNWTEVENLCQTVEGKFSALKRREARFSPELFDELHLAVDSLATKLRSRGPENKTEEPRATNRSPSAEVREARETAAGSPGVTDGTVSASFAPPAAESPSGGTVRIATAKLDAIFLQAEELLSAKLAAQRRAADLRETASAFTLGRRRRFELRPSLQGLDTSRQIHSSAKGSVDGNAHLERVLEYLEWEDAHSKFLENSLAEQVRAGEQDARSLAGRLDSLVEEMKRLLMLPFAPILALLPKLVRDLSREQGKEIDFEIQGSEVEVDKRILEEMKDPLIHLLRNCADHGIEKPQVRAAKMKSLRGRMILSIKPKDAGRIEVLITDDGAGIEFERVRAAAVKQGVITESEAAKLDEAATLSLVFRSGVSTNPILTDLSGRGLGLAIVKEKVEKLGGTVEVETHRDAGTTFRMVLPVTLATSRGILVRSGEHIFILPTSGVERVTRVSSEDVRTVENRETIELGGQAIAFERLEDVLELPRRPTTDGKGKRPALVLSSSGTRLAFGVDEILGEQEVLVKNPPKPMSRVGHMAGATVMGSGEVVPILNVADLVKSVARAGRATFEPERAEAGPSKPKSILVAEDSITARSLLKGILESAGFAVRTAVDGADAFATLKTEVFDLVVSDVDMPRMSGFDLTAKIRADKTLSKTPVVLVTALESREDRELGIDVGADAYIVKSSFDQSNLLEIVQRLI